MPVIIIRVMGGANMLKTEGLMLESVYMGQIGAGCQAEFPIISICAIGAKGSETMHVIGLGLHKASKVKGFRGKAWKDIERVSRNNIQELRNNSGER
jgi:hypothetical protein